MPLSKNLHCDRLCSPLPGATALELCEGTGEERSLELGGGAFVGIHDVKLPSSGRRIVPPRSSATNWTWSRCLLHSTLMPPALFTTACVELHALYSRLVQREAASGPCSSRSATSDTTISCSGSMFAKGGRCRLSARRTLKGWRNLDVSVAHERAEKVRISQSS